MGVVRFKLDRKGIQALVSSDEAQSVVNEAAEELRARAGDGFKVHSSNKGKRARAFVSRDAPAISRHLPRCCPAPSLGCDA